MGNSLIPQKLLTLPFKLTKEPLPPAVETAPGCFRNEKRARRTGQYFFSGCPFLLSYLLGIGSIYRASLARVQFNLPNFCKDRLFHLDNFYFQSIDSKSWRFRYS